ncbi:hypothetical protein [Amphibacillus xylanus]|uniref:hypothetical protein n=1 Tax=Amphibacillus xylanus TaxID=1449 RepID=UPI0012DC8831|nr:hypothetical protein [Amphibacillus xylanus]
METLTIHALSLTSQEIFSQNDIELKLIEFNRGDSISKSIFLSTIVPLLHS